jgi:pimeloyl-ACP methyl ester carboxylesterase
MQPSLIFIPGNMCDARVWHAVSDLPGWIRVDAPPLGQASIAAMATAVLAKLHGPIMPVGFSMGGIVALEMARQAPERVKAMVLIDTNAGADLPERAALRPIQQARVQNGELATIVADELKPAYLAAANRNNAPLKQLLFDMAMDLGEDIFMAQSEALRTRDDLGPVFDTFAGPVAVMCGAEDRLCPPEWHEAMARRAKDAQLTIIPDAGHMLPLEQPGAFSAALISWLDNYKGEFHT